MDVSLNATFVVAFRAQFKLEFAISLKCRPSQLVNDGADLRQGGLCGSGIGPTHELALTSQTAKLTKIGGNRHNWLDREFGISLKHKVRCNGPDHGHFSADHD
jgi:hypothetical protein